MSKCVDSFRQNIARVENLCALFSYVKESKTRPTVKEADILRAAVVFLHSALENYLRGTIAEWLPKCGDRSAIDDIPLPSSENRAEKFKLGALMKFSERKISDLIQESVQQHMLRVSFNNYTDICNWLGRIKVGLSEFKEQDTIEVMIGRRHRIVHEADANQKSGPGNHYAASINLQTVQKWKGVTVDFVEIVEAQISKKTAGE